jgi:pimeloyl-ACP methyl ester carboxylesterase
LALTGPQFVTIDGRRLEYQWYGPPADQAPTLVFLHEGLGSISLWRDFPETVCRQLGWGGLVYNRLGYGGSDSQPRPLSNRFMHDEALEVLPRLLETFGIARPALFGHSDGGSIAIIYAGTQVSQPRALVLEAPHVFVEDVTRTSIAALAASYRSTDLRARLERHHGPNVDRLFDAWTEIWLSERFRSWSLEQVLPAITAPILVIQGRDDEYGTVRQVEAIAARASGFVQTLLLDACRHSAHTSQRSLVETAVIDFLNHRAAP